MNRRKRTRSRHVRASYKGWLRKVKRRALSLLAASVIINVLLINQWVENSKEADRLEIVHYQKGIDKGKVAIKEMYDLEKYPTYSYPSQSMGYRIDRLYERYTRHLNMRDRYHDFHDEKSSFYAKGTRLKKSYRRQFEYAIRRVIALKFRVQIIEQNIKNVCANNEELLSFFYRLENRAQHKERLSEMQNFYSRYIPEHQYDNLITKTID